MNQNKFSTAGWLAIAGAILILPVLPGAIIVDVMHQKGVLNAPFAGLFLTLSVAQSLMVIYAFYRFKAYLNELHEFHGTDLLITVIIIGAVVMTTIGVIARLTTWAGASDSAQLIFVAVLVIVGIPLGVLSVIFGIKLLELKDGGEALIKPYAYINIVAGALFATFFLAPIGLLVSAVGDLLMGFMMLGKGPQVRPDFV